MNYNTIICRTSGGQAIISFNRPQRLNAVTGELYAEVEGAIHEAEQNSDVRVIILRGEGRAFCVGADLKEHHNSTRTPDEKRAYAEVAQRVCAKIQESSLPFIAAVHGYALGAGAEMALSCDFVIMQAEAEIGFPEVSIGTYVGGGLSYILPRLVGLAKARELLLVGRRINGGEAEAIGLIYKAVDETEFNNSVDNLATILIEKAPIPLAFAKKQLQAHAIAETGKAMEREVDALLACMETEDWKEGVKAFNEKRKPVFKGR